MIHLALNGTLVIVTPEKEEFEKWICESKFFGFRCEREKKNERNFHIHKKNAGAVEEERSAVDLFSSGFFFSRDRVHRECSFIFTFSPTQAKGEWRFL
jgi:hypothetical protein